MRALWLESQTVRYRTDVPEPSPADGEALIRVLAAGVCNTDLEMTRGYHPFDGILGHEFVGAVEQGPAHLLQQRVVGDINVCCGGCSACLAGRKTHCLHRTVMGIRGRHGAFADYLALPVENLHIVPDSVATDAAVFAEPLAAALEIQEQLEIGPGQRVVVLGAGKLGQLIVRTLALTGCELVAVGRHRSGLDLIAELGVRTAGPDDIGDERFDVAVECTGNPEGIALAIRAVRARGTVVLKSTHSSEVVVDTTAIVVNELTVIGSRCGPLPRALDVLTQGRVNVESLIEARYSLEDGLEALEHSARPGVLKVLIQPD